jgi:hypothetical protein
VRGKLKRNENERTRISTQNVRMGRRKRETERETEMEFSSPPSLLITKTKHHTDGIGCRKKLFPVCV